MRFRLSLLVLCSLLSSYALIAQEDIFGKQTFMGGVTIGGNASALMGDVYPGYHKAGLNIGAAVFARLSPIFAASLEISYSQKGCRGVREIYSNYTGQTFEKYYLNLNYMEMPLYVYFTGGSRLFFGLGVCYSRLIKSREWISSDQPYNIDNNLYSFLKDDWSYGGNVNFSLPKKWIVSFRYQQSFQPIRRAYYVPLNLGTGDQFNTWFTLRLIKAIP